MKQSQLGGGGENSKISDCEFGSTWKKTLWEEVRQQPLFPIPQIDIKSPSCISNPPPTFLLKAATYIDMYIVCMYIYRASLRFKKTEFLDKSSKTIDIYFTGLFRTEVKPQPQSMTIHPTFDKIGYESLKFQSGGASTLNKSERIIPRKIFDKILENCPKIPNNSSKKPISHPWTYLTISFVKPITSAMAVPIWISLEGGGAKLSRSLYLALHFGSKKDWI